MISVKLILAGLSIPACIVVTGAALDFFLSRPGDRTVMEQIWDAVVLGIRFTGFILVCSAMIAWLVWGISTIHNHIEVKKAETQLER